MRKLVAGLYLIAVATTGIRAANALEVESVTGFCPTISGTGSETWVCSESWSRAEWQDVFLLGADEVEVTGFFQGRGYNVERHDNSTIIPAIPSTWTARVQFADVCAYSGLHSTDGQHVGWVDALPFGGPTQTHAEAFLSYCDCDSPLEVPE